MSKSTLAYIYTKFEGLTNELKNAKILQLIKWSIMCIYEVEPP